MFIFAFWLTMFISFILPPRALIIVLNLNMRILVITNSVLSEEESNGRICRSLLNAFSNDELCSFGLRGIPNCEGVNYRVVTDKDALRAFVTLGIKQPAGRLESGSSQRRSKSSGSAKGHILRDIVWFSGFWRGKKQRKWEKSHDISAVFLMAADTAFLYRYARKIAKSRGVPLVVYSSEDYPLKRYDYMSKKTGMSLLCRLFLRKLRKEAKRAFEYASVSMFGCEELDALYSKTFALKEHYVVYQPGSVGQPICNRVGRPVERVVYAGNINQNRLSSLLEIAEAVKRLKPTIRFELYGPIRDEWSDLAIQKHDDLVHYRGLLPYNQLLKEYGVTDLLVHAEGFDGFNRLDYAHSFSTKIGDCYLSGVPFFQYGPQELPCIAFGLKICPNYVATGPDELLQKLKPIVESTADYHLNRAQVVEKFDPQKVGRLIRTIIERQ